MANELTTIGADALALVNQRYGAIARDDYGRDTLPVPLSAAERKAVQEHRRAIHAKLRPISEAKAEQDRAAAAIALFLGGYLSFRSPDPAGVVRVYVSALSSYPLFAILEALDDFQHGRVYDVDKDGSRIAFSLDFPPSAPRLLAQVKKRSDPVFEARHKAERVLAITKIAEPDIPEDERERVAVLMADLASSMRNGVERQRQKDREIIRAEADGARERAARITEEGLRKRQSEAHAG